MQTQSKIGDYIGVLVKLVPEIENAQDEELYEILQKMQSYETRIFQEMNDINRKKLNKVSEMIDEKNAIIDTLKRKEEVQTTYLSKITSTLNNIKTSFVETVKGKPAEPDEIERLKARQIEINSIQLIVDIESFTLISHTEKMQRFYQQLDEKIAARNFTEAKKAATDRIIMFQRVDKQTTKSESFISMLNKECSSDISYEKRR